jgi:hypothetical protein
MFATTQSANASNETNPFFPQLALRRRSNEHPMVMFAALAALGLGAMALAPGAAPALAAGDRAPVKMAETVPNTGKGPRLVQLSDSEIACYGQAWGSESEECLVAMASESGKQTHQIRMIASAEPDVTRPNVF